MIIDYCRRKYDIIAIRTIPLMQDCLEEIYWNSNHITNKRIFWPIKRKSNGA